MSDEIRRICEQYNCTPAMSGDYMCMEENKKNGHKLCDRCGGTGNEILFMYKKCTACNGNGRHKEEE